jgi:hypothetical protein
VIQRAVSPKPPVRFYQEEPRVYGGEFPSWPPALALSDHADNEFAMRFQSRAVRRSGESTL